MKPRAFIGSSTESLPIANAVHESLDYNVECTVWHQAIFGLSESSLDSLLNALGKFDFGIFIVGPEDILKLRGQEYRTARDNVIFELGLFIGKLGKKRNFILAPRGQTDFHLPTDLVGLTPADYDPNRSDGNLIAALGPACSKIVRAMQDLGPLVQQSDATLTSGNELDYDDVDKINMISASIKSRRDGYSDIYIKYQEIDNEHGFTPGTTAKFIEDAVLQTGIYTLKTVGQTTASLKYRIVV